MKKRMVVCDKNQIMSSRLIKFNFLQKKFQFFLFEEIVNLQKYSHEFYLFLYKITLNKLTSINKKYNLLQLF